MGVRAEAESPPACIKEWAELDEREREAAHELGYDAHEWGRELLCATMDETD